MAKAQRFDVGEYLESPEDVANYLSEALVTGDAEYIAQAIGTVARAQGMAEHLYRALNAGGNPKFITVLKVLDALGVRLEARAKAA